MRAYDILSGGFSTTWARGGMRTGRPASAEVTLRGGQFNARVVEATRSQDAFAGTSERQTTDQLLQTEMQTVRAMLKSFQQAAAAATGDFKHTSDRLGPTFAEAPLVPPGQMAALKPSVKKQASGDIPALEAKQKMPRKQKKCQSVNKPESAAPLTDSAHRAGAAGRHNPPDSDPEALQSTRKVSAVKSQPSVVRSVATDHAVHPHAVRQGRGQLPPAPEAMVHASKPPPAAVRPVPVTATKTNLHFTDDPELSAWAGGS
jgi:hypothetical protein